MTNRYLAALFGIAITACIQSGLLLFQHKNPVMPDKNLFVTELALYSELSNPPRQTPKVEPEPAVAVSPKTSKTFRKSEPEKPSRSEVKKDPELTPPVSEQVSARQNSEVPADNKPIPVPLYEIDVMPQMIGRLKPEYPESMRRLGRTGKLKLAILIDRRGRVIDIDVLSSAGEEFDRAAIDAIKKSRFSPALIGQRPVPVRIILPVKFSLL